jgi:hypothetical protein
VALLSPAFLWRLGLSPRRKVLDLKDRVLGVSLRRGRVAYLRLAIIASTSTEAATLTLADLWQGTLF